KAGVSSDATGFTITDGTNITTISVNSSSTMDDVVNTINSQLAAATGSGGLGLTGVTASFASGKFTISGHSGTLTIGNLTGSTSAETIGNRGLVTALNLPTTATSTPLSSSSTISINEQTITSDAGVTEFSSSATLDSGSTGGLGLTSTTGEIRVNGTLITYDTSTDTLTSLISTINSSGANVLASYDSLTGKITMQNKSTGASVVTIDDNSGNDNAGLISALKLDSSSSAVTTLGQNAIYSINGGASKSSTSNTITNAISGATITLAGTLDTTATVTIAQDSTTALTNVKAFVTAYNDAMAWVIENTKVDAATKTRGVFAGDSAITAMQSKLRSAINSAASSISTTYKTLPSIGLSSGAVGSTVGTTNTLVLDESKFTAALAADSTAVSSLFGSSSGPLDTLKTYLVAATSYSGLIYSSQTSADTQLRDLDKRISTMQQRLDDKQASLQKKYADLEAAMSKLQAQSSSLSSQLAGLNKSG
ncbi:MAG: flagellar filament capping protein FliD, partial [Chloroflexi bacterium]|nr:flagellar filament capping protein FliD [Chloroflexota bacterium]